MKNLGKKRNHERMTVNAYSCACTPNCSTCSTYCTCNCQCSCGDPNSAIYNGVATGQSSSNSAVVGPAVAMGNGTGRASALANIA